MHYQTMRNQAKSGDVLLVEGQGIVSRLIRALTGQNISHVAMLLWFGNNLFVCEMKEFTGYRLRPASLWVDDVLGSGDRLYYGLMPKRWQGNPHDELIGKKIANAALAYRNRSYSYSTLMSVWWAQITRKKTSAGLVCSTFVQRCWEACGLEFKQTADPGDYMHLCESTHAIKGASNER